MLPPSKKLKTNKPLEQQQEEEDTLSNLPHPILHQILSFLPDIKYTILTSTLSKTWSSVSKTTSFLDFNFETYGGIAKTRQPYQFGWFTQFLEFVNKVLTSHCSGSGTSSSTIQRFSLHCGNKYVIPSSTLKKWIEIVIGRGVQDVSIEFLSEQVVLDLPENLASLVEGDIDIGLPFAGIDQVCGNMIETWEKKYDMMKFFGGLSNARSLTLCPWSLEVIGVGSEITPIVFSGLRQLKLKTCLINNCLPGIKHLLENSCNLDTLVMEMTWEPYSEDHYMNTADNELLVELDILNIPDSWLDDWETAVVPVTDSLFSHLKFVEVWTTLGSGHDLDFIRILLKNAMALEKLNIINSKEHPLCSEGQLMEFSARVLAFQRASSNVEIVFFQA